MAKLTANPLKNSQRLCGEKTILESYLINFHEQLLL